jgi:S1-C subfamily serine protease
MKRILALVAALILALTPLYAKPDVTEAKVPVVSREVEHSSVGAIFMTAPGEERRFICSGSEIGSDSEGNGIFLTARHCVWNSDSNVFYPNEEVSFSDDEKGPFYSTKLYAISQTDDLALLIVINAGGIPTQVLEDEHALKAGDPVENISFPYGMGKLEFHGNFVSSIFPNFPKAFLDGVPQWRYTMPVDITIEPGSSGSPLFDSKTHCVVGVMVGLFNPGALTIAEPVSRLLEMTAHLDENTPEAFIKAHPIQDPKVQDPTDNTGVDE